MVSTDNSILSNVLPELEKVQCGFLRDTLNKSFCENKDLLNRIEGSFRAAVDGADNEDCMKYFFKSWSMTNHSCMRVSAISNRLSLQKHKNQDIHNEEKFFQSIASLNRIADADLGVGGGELHHDMFYRMATPICGNDEWQLGKYCTNDARLFKTWADHNALKEDDMLVGLATTLIHEIYTHGEVEHIEPLFKEWLINSKGYSEEESKKTVFWITAHCYPTEVKHFRHGLQAVEYYCDAVNINIESFDIMGVFNKYLEMKCNVMDSLTAIYQNQN